MSQAAPNRPIRAELLAEKMQALRDFELPELQAEIAAEPRLVETLWHIQWASQSDNYPGGLARFAADLIADSHDLIGTAGMRAHGSAPYSFETAKAVYAEIPSRVFNVSGPVGLWELDALCGQECGAQSQRDWESEAAKEIRRVTAPENLLRLCQREAAANLADYLRSLCESRHVRFTRRRSADAHRSANGQAPWYFAEIGTALLRFIDRQRAILARTIAQTEITVEIYKWLSRAQASRRSIRIVGNSRFGKTEAVRTWCRMNPGLARLVNTPASNSESDLLRAVAIALGIEVGARQTAARLRESIDYVIRHGRLLLAFDEAHFLLPTCFSRTTAPARLNWVRRSVMDAGVACAFIATPQSYDGAKRRFVSKTAYTIEQFDERSLKTVELPERLTDADLLLVARIHFPEQAEDYLRLVVGKVLLAGRSFVSDLEKIAVLARVYAQEDGKAALGLSQINAAIADVLPTPTKASLPAAIKRPATLPQPAGNRVATPLPDSCDEREADSPSRINFDQLTPAEIPLGAPA